MTLSSDFPEEGRSTGVYQRQRSIFHSKGGGVRAYLLPKENKQCKNAVEVDEKGGESVGVAVTKEVAKANRERLSFQMA